MWRLLYCQHKLTIQECATFQSILDDTSYTCGATLEDLHLPNRLAGVCVKDHSCYGMVEKLYYSCGYKPICIYCSSENVEESTEFFPQCQRMWTAKGLRSVQGIFFVYAYIHTYIQDVFSLINPIGPRADISARVNWRERIYPHTWHYRTFHRDNPYRTAALSSPWSFVMSLKL